MFTFFTLNMSEIANNENLINSSLTRPLSLLRRYLKRRPMTTTDLLKKFRSKKTGIQNAQLVQLLANILKKINPHKHKVPSMICICLALLSLTHNFR